MKTKAIFERDFRSTHADLKGKVAAMTGGSCGIGTAIAVELGVNVASVALVRRDRDALDSSAAAVSAPVEKAIGVVADCTVEKLLAEMHSTVSEQDGMVHILAVFAGGNGMPVPTCDGTSKHWHENGLRTTFLAAVVLVLVELCLSITVILYATLPATDNAKALLSAFGSAVTRRPVILALHPLLGTILLITGMWVFVRTSLARQTRFIVITGVSILGTVVAWLSGARFVGTIEHGASLTMAMAAGISIFCYAFILFSAPGTSLKKGTM